MSAELVFLVGPVGGRLDGPQERGPADRRVRVPVHVPLEPQVLDRHQMAGVPPAVQIPVGDSRVVLVRALQVDAFRGPVDCAVQDPALVRTFAEHRLPDRHQVAVPVLDHASNLQALRGRALQAVHRAHLRLERLPLPRLVSAIGNGVSDGLFESEHVIQNYSC